MRKKEIEARRFFLSGRVQGVGCRIFAQSKARDLGITGYARNLRDGRVEVFAMGTSEQLTQLREKLVKGPRMARVDTVNEEPAPVDARYSNEFSIEYTI